MKQRISNNWHVLRVLRLIAGIAIAAQAWYLKEWLLLAAGAGFAALALFHAGCCGVNACGTNHNSDINKEKETVYEEVV